jgi:hypothetical protein
MAAISCSQNGAMLKGTILELTLVFLQIFMIFFIKVTIQKFSLYIRTHIRRTGHNPPRGFSADWWMLTTVNAVRTKGFTCLPKHGRAQDNLLSPYELIHKEVLCPSSGDINRLMMMIHTTNALSLKK